MVVIWRPYRFLGALFAKIKSWKNCRGVAFPVLTGLTRVDIHKKPISHHFLRAAKSGVKTESKRKKQPAYVS